MLFGDSKNFYSKAILGFFSWIVETFTKCFFKKPFCIPRLLDNKAVSRDRKLSSAVIYL